MHLILKKIFLFSFLLFPTSQFFAQVVLDGYVTDAQTKEPLQGIKVQADIYENGAIYLGTYGPISTDFQGFYSFNITSVDESERALNSQITYLSQAQFIIYQNGNHRTKISLIDLIGQEKTIIEKDFTDIVNIKLDLAGFASGLYFIRTEIGKDVYINKLLKTGTNYHWGIVNPTNSISKSINKIAVIGAIMSYIDTTGIHHKYDGPVGDFANNTPKRSMALPKVVYLPDSMKFTDPEVNYPINTEIRLWQYMARIIDQNDYKSFGNHLMPMKIYDPGTEPQWTQPIIDGTNNIRNQTTHNPDSLVQMTNEFKTIAYSNGFSQINIVYADSNLIGQDDHGLLFFYSSTNNAFVGAELYINTSTNQQPIDIYKAIQRDIQKYQTGTIGKIDNPKYLGTNTRGEPYNITTPEMHLIDITRTLQDIIKENGKQPIFTNRFLHPGTLVANNPSSLPDPKTEILELFNNVPGVKIKVID